MLWEIQGLRNEYLRGLEWLFGYNFWGDFVGLESFFGIK